MCCESGGKAPLAARCLAGMAALRSGERVAETLGVAGAVVACACSGLDRHAGQRRQGHPGRGEPVAEALFKVVLTGWVTFVGCGYAREVVVQSSYWREPRHNGDYMATGAYGGELMRSPGHGNLRNHMVRIVCSTQPQRWSAPRRLWVVLPQYCWIKAAVLWSVACSYALVAVDRQSLGIRCARRHEGSLMTNEPDVTTCLLGLGGRFKSSVASVCRPSNSERKAIGSELRTMPSRGTGRGLAP